MIDIQMVWRTLIRTQLEVLCVSRLGEVTGSDLVFDASAKLMRKHIQSTTANKNCRTQKDWSRKR